LKVPRYDLPKSAPAPLRLVQEFVNTSDREHGRELLPGRAELRTWLRTRNLIAQRANVQPSDVRRTRELREALRALLVAHSAGTTPQLAELEALNRVADRARVGIAFGERGVEVVVRARGVDRALGEIVAIVVAAVRDGRWAHLKACRNCHWAFYDYSRNHSATWCSMALCGNRLKTRAYRRRQAHRD